MRDTYLHRVHGFIASLDQAMGNQMTAQNSKLSFQNDVARIAQMHDLRSQDLEAMKNLTLGQIMNAFEQARIPHDPKLGKEPPHTPNHHRWMQQRREAQRTSTQNISAALEKD